MFIYHRLKINHDSHEFILEFGTVANISNPDGCKKGRSRAAGSHTPQVTNRREGGLKSCHCHSQKLHAFSYKGLETVEVAQKLLGAPTIGRGSAWAKGGSGRS
jgi:hypothetical protein